MSSSDRYQAPNKPDTASAASQPAPGVDPYANWLDRMQKARVRHAAITRNLYTWANYKTWAERVKGNWEDGKDPKP